MDVLLLLFDIAPETMQRDARVVGDGPVWQHLATDFAQQTTEIRHRRRALLQQGELIGGKQRAHVVRSLEKSNQVGDLGCFERSSLNA